DCAYPDATPAISRVDGNGQFGPYVDVSKANRTLTITALGDQIVPNNAYSGPAASTAPFNQKTITRHSGFGPAGQVTIGGTVLTVTSWSDTQIVATVPSTTHTGELVITSGNGKK